MKHIDEITSLPYHGEMESRAEKTKKRILDCAQNEFLKNGYTDSSVRKIAQDAQVTTGAVYRHFPNGKEELFEHLVHSEYKRILAVLDFANRSDKKLQRNPFGYSGTKDDKALFDDFFEYMYENIHPFELLLEKSAGTKYENCIDEFSAKYAQQVITIFNYFAAQGIHDIPIEPSCIHILSKAFIQSCSEIIFKKLPKEEAKKHYTQIADFFILGFNNLKQR